MQVFVVAEVDYDHYRQHGIFGELAQAEAYMQMVEASEASQADGHGRVWGTLEIRPVELDALVGAQPIYIAYAGSEDAELSHYGHLPEPAVGFYADTPTRPFYAYGRTVAEAHGNFRDAAAAAAVSNA